MGRRLPPWAMGLANAPLGFYYGFISTAMPILLAARGVGVARIAAVSTVAFAPSFSAWLVCPVLDVRFTKKAYAVFFYCVAAVCLVASVLLLERDLGWLTVALTAGCAAAVIAGNAVGGWLPDLVGEEHYDAVGAWFNVANLGAAGVFGTVAVLLAERLAAGTTAVLLGLLLLAPTGLLLFFPPGERPRRSAGVVFRSFFADLRLVMLKRSNLYGLLCFLLPASAFAMTNLFAGLAADFHTSERAVTAIGGMGVAVACSVGCLAGIPLCRRFSRQTVYLGIGLGGAAVAAAMAYAPRTLGVFAVGVLAYNFCQGINYTSYAALIFEIVGRENVLAATQLSLLMASVNAPISYMTAVDGVGYARGGVTGMLLADAGFSLLAGVPLLVFFAWRGRKDAAVPA